MLRTSIRQIKPFLIGWCICLIAMGYVVGKVAPIQRGDFRAFYAAGYMVRTHPAQLYNVEEQERVQAKLISFENGVLPYYHLDYEALIFAPFSLLNYRAAYISFLLFNLLLLIGVFFAARAAFSMPIPYLQPRPGLMFFLFIPLLYAIAEGQDSILSLLLYCMAWRQLQANKNWSAGLYLALAMFKFHLVLPIAILMTIRTGWRFAAGFLTTCVGIVLLCFGIVGWDGMMSLIHLLRDAGSALHKGSAVQRSMSVYPQSMPSIAGLLHSIAHLLGFRSDLNLLIGACVVALFVWCAIRVRCYSPGIAFSIAILCSTLMSYHVYLYELTLCLLPMALLSRHVHWSIIAAMLGLPVFIVFGVGTNWAFLMALPLIALLASVLLQTPKADGAALTLQPIELQQC